MQAFLKWFGPTPGPGQHKFTLDELRELYGILIKNPVVTEANRAIVVETIRAIAEFMIWGDQNEPRIFDFFLEHNIMTYLHRILLQPANRSGDVAKQVLQTLSIIIQNVKSETAVFFLFSNNHINNIVDLDFDFEDEEVLGYYVSFLKTISLKLNVGTVQFFFDTTGSDTVAFPLYTRAIRLAHHREGMVRAAVRTLTLNVFSVDVPEIQSFVTSPPSDRFFLEVAAYLREQVQLLDRRLAAAEGGSVQALGSLDSALAEVEDVLSYCSDALGLGVSCIAHLLAENLWNVVVGPVLLRALMEPAAISAATAGAQQAVPGTAGQHLRQSSWGSTRSPFASAEGAASGSPRTGGSMAPAPRIRPVCALYVLERLYQLVSYGPLLHQALLALAAEDEAAAGSGGDADATTAADGMRGAGQVCNTGATASTSQPGGPRSSDGGSSGGAAPGSGRRSLFEALDGASPYAAVMALRLLAAVLLNRSVAPEVLLALGMRVRRQLLQQPAANGIGVGGASQHARQLLQACMQRQQQGQQVGAAGAAGSTGSMCAWLAQQYLGQQVEDQPVDPLGGITCQLEGASLGGGEEALLFSGMGDALVRALLHLLQTPHLPATGLWLTAWLLHQLLPMQPQAHAEAALGAQPGSALQPEQQEQVAAALEAAQGVFLGQMSSMWCEALFPMLANEWATTREQVLRPVLRASTEGLLCGSQCYPLLSKAPAPAAAAAGSVAPGAAPAAARASAALAPGQEPGLSQSARSALSAYWAVQRVVALKQLNELLASGAVPRSPPAPTVSDAELKQVDIQEGCSVDLQPGSAIPCVVSFAPGLERRVYFAVAGLSRKFSASPVKGGGSASGGANASLLRSLPVIVLADPLPATPTSGLVVSVAPLLGANPTVDSGVAKWLHVHVRPSVRGLLRVIKTAGSKKGGLLPAMRQLADGHWVLAFPDGERAAAAPELVQRHTKKLRAMYLDLLTPGFGPGATTASGEGAAEARAEAADRAQARQGERHSGQLAAAEAAGEQPASAAGPAADAAAVAEAEAAWEPMRAASSPQQPYAGQQHVEPAASTKEARPAEASSTSISGGALGATAAAAAAAAVAAAAAPSAPAEPAAAAGVVEEEEQQPAAAAPPLAAELEAAAASAGGWSTVDEPVTATAAATAPALADEPLLPAADEPSLLIGTQAAVPHASTAPALPGDAAALAGGSAAALGDADMVVEQVLEDLISSAASVDKMA